MRFSGRKAELEVAGLLLVLLVGATVVPRWSWGQSGSVRDIEYHGIRPTDPGGRVGLRNPERGWRTETLIGEPSGAKVWGPAYNAQGKVTPGYHDEWWILPAELYEPFGLTLLQTYCYLTDYVDKPIPPEKLEALGRSLDNLRRCGFKAVLRFAYEKDMKREGGPTLEWMLRHMEQLQPIIRKNADVIFVLQAGFIGAWGEWHSSTHIGRGDYVSRAAILAKLLEVLPKDRMTQVRVPKYKRLALSEEIFGGFEEVNSQTAYTGAATARIGFHNDGFLAGKMDGGTWPEEPNFGSPGNEEFDTMTRQSAYVPVDGELFWSDQQSLEKGVDGFQSALRMRLHHYSSFSLAHSYSGQEGKNYSIDRWMVRPITKEQLEEAKMPISEGYFEDQFGDSMSRTPFEYIRDHLGYRLELQQARIPTKMEVGGEFSMEVDLINRGFSTLHNRRAVYIVLIGADGRVHEFEAKDTDVRKWQPFEPGDEDYEPLRHMIRVEGSLEETIKPGWYKVGLWLPDMYESLRLDSRYAVRTANRDTLWWRDDKGRYGVNLLGTVEIKIRDHKAK
ncbi:MAG: DUF4832 domain-containing protein [Sedimentisphaerales bacterium]|nr:DUF4832 domain-containing protein [Sedimentisphaerales bacterium]